MEKTVVKVLKAFEGDCIIIHTYDADGNRFNILLDGGTPGTFKTSLRKELEYFEEEKLSIDLLILTHIDNDHIGGILKFIDSSYFDNIEVKKYFLNGGNLIKINEGTQVSISQGLEFEKYLLTKEKDRKKWGDEVVFTAKEIKLANGIICKILSPDNKGLELLLANWKYLSDEEIQSYQVAGSVVTKAKDFDIPFDELAKRDFKPDKSLEEDYFNNSSIAFILECPDFKGLFLGDTCPETIITSLKAFEYTKENPLKVDIVKVSHHGSKNNTSNELLELIQCKKFVISTHGGKGSTKHPDRETIARIVAQPNITNPKEIELNFNYPKEEIENKIGKFITENEDNTYNFVFNREIF